MMAIALMNVSACSQSTVRKKEVPVSQCDPLVVGNAKLLEG